MLLRLAALDVYVYYIVMISHAVDIAGAVTASAVSPKIFLFRDLLQPPLCFTVVSTVLYPPINTLRSSITAAPCLGPVEVTQAEQV